ncbi:hypothetical protein CRG98_027787, partial [Punica granatum]
MSDVSEDEKSSRLRTSSSKKKEAGDGSVKSIEVPPVYRHMSSDSTGAQILGCNLNGDNYLTWSRAMLIAGESIPEAAVFLAKEETEQRRAGFSKLQGISEGRPSCSNCGKMGHTKSFCWALIGYSSWHSKPKTNPGKGPGQGQARENSGPRAKAQFQHGPDRANAVQTGLSSGSRAEQLETLPDEQFQRLLSMLSQDTMDPSRLVGNESNFVNLRNEWILDTRASRHMMGCLENFSRMTPIKGGLPVYIPNGGMDRTSRRTLGVGELQGGVYYIRRVATTPQTCQTSCTDTPQQNGRVERKHWHILNVARSLMFKASLPTRFWGECVSTVVHLINVTPTPLLGNKSPHELLFGKPPNYSNLRVFGSLCYAHIRTKDKFESRSQKCVFIGYPHGKKGWRLYDLKNHQMFVSRDVRFCETIFPFATENDESRQPRKSNPLFLDGDGPIISGGSAEDFKSSPSRSIHLGESSSGRTSGEVNWKSSSPIRSQKSGSEAKDRPRNEDGFDSAQKTLETDRREKGMGQSQEEKESEGPRRNSELGQRKKGTGRSLE